MGGFSPSSVSGAGIVRWLEHWTRASDRKVSAGAFSFPGSTFCADSCFATCSTSVTAVACKRFWSFCQKCWWQVTVKHTRMYLWIKWHCMVYTVQGCMAYTELAPRWHQFYLAPAMLQLTKRCCLAPFCWILIKRALKVWASALCTFYNNPAPLNGSMQFHYCTLVTREPEQTTLLFWSAACGVTPHGLHTADRR